MITEDYVSFETAKLLKEKGFNEYCPLWYNLDKPIEGPFFYKGIGWYGHNSYDYNGKRIVSAPTLQRAMKWLREVHNLYIQTEIILWPQKGYFVKIYLYKNRYNDFEEMPFVEHKESYEEACEAALKYSLENLI